MSICKVLFLLFRGLFVSRSDLILENLVLRQQLTIQQRTVKRSKLKNKDRIFWSWLSQIWPDWKSNLIIVKPETVIKWHRQDPKDVQRAKRQKKAALKKRKPAPVVVLSRIVTKRNSTSTQDYLVAGQHAVGE